MNKFVLPALLLISSTYASACVLTPSTPNQISYRQDVGSITSMFAGCIVSVANGAVIGRPDLTGIKAINPRIQIISATVMDWRRGEASC